MKHLKEKSGTLLLVVAVLVLILPIVFLVSGIMQDGSVYSTNNLKDYRKITGNYDNETPAAFINSFFPGEIDESFQDVSYYYNAQKGDTYACQAWLSFTIEDEQDFSAFIESATKSDHSIAFAYDSSYMDYTVSNCLLLTSSEQNAAFDDIHISYAQIGKVLYDTAAHRVIFYALCVEDGGYSSMKTLGDFFAQFDIDPTEFEATAYATPYYQELGIQNQDR